MREFDLVRASALNAARDLMYAEQLKKQADTSGWIDAVDAWRDTLDWQFLRLSATVAPKETEELD